MTSFADLGLSAPLLAALATQNHHIPTPIQAQAIPHVLVGRDLLGIAQTGTGKTAAFALPILQRLAADGQRPQPRACRALILSPTRELASQIAQSFRDYGRGLRLSTAVVFGGVDIRRQMREMSRGVDILVATPGRLVDHLNQGTIRLDQAGTIVLDEVDRMLDMGFAPTVRRLLARLPRARQSLFFSATLPPEIARLADDLLNDPVAVTVKPVAATTAQIEQHVVHVDQARKPAALAAILADAAVTRALVFTRTKHRADKVARQLIAAGINAATIHGNKSQSQRERALAAFRKGAARVLVATDVAARGIDVEHVTDIINFELPDEPESYVHRIGRTGRAGAVGRAIAFCDPAERSNLRGIEAHLRQRVPVMEIAGVPSPSLPVREPLSVSRPQASRRADHGAAGVRHGQPRRHAGEQGRGAPRSRGGERRTAG